MIVVARLSESCASDHAPAITPYTPAELRYLATLGLVELETIEGTPIHPIWSADRRDWVPLGELTEGERLQAADGSALVVSVTIDDHLVPVYNIEVHGEHVYQVGAFGLLVHNTYLNAPKGELPILNPNFTPKPTTHGRVGEVLSGLTGNKTKLSINGRNRIPDALTGTTLTEVKNVANLSYTRQLRDFADYARQNGLVFELYVRPNTTLSGPLLQAIQNGDIILKTIPGL